MGFIFRLSLQTLGHFFFGRFNSNREEESWHWKSWICESMICKSVFCWNLSAKSHINFHFFLESREILRWRLLIILASFFVHFIPIEKKIINHWSNLMTFIRPSWSMKSNLFISKIYGNIYVHIYGFTLLSSFKMSTVQKI